jgi:hypothetical protein
MCLLADSPARLDERLRRDEVFRKAVAAGFEPVGKTVRTSHGYIQFLSEDAGRWQPELPDVVRPEDVVELPDADPVRAPAQDYLRRAAGEMRRLSTTWPAGDYAEKLEASLKACSPDFDGSILRSLPQTLNQLAWPGWPPDASPLVSSEYVAAVRSALNTGAEVAAQMRSGLIADGMLTAALVAICDLGQASAERSAVQPSRRAFELWQLVRAIIAVPTLGPEIMVAAVARQLVLSGQHWLVRERVEAYDSFARLGIERALNARGILTFHTELFEAIVPQLVVLLIARQVQHDVDRVDDQHYWQARSENAEERCIRIAESFRVAFLNLHWAPEFAVHRQHVRRIRETSGDSAARLVARNYIESYLYYPRHMHELLMSDRPLPEKPALVLG